MIFHEYEVAVAYSMIRCAERLTEPLSRFACYWMAFNNLYVTVADRKGLRAEYRKLPNGNIETTRCGHVDVPKVKLSWFSVKWNFRREPLAG